MSLVERRKQFTTVCTVEFQDHHPSEINFAFHSAGITKRIFCFWIIEAYHKLITELGNLIPAIPILDCVMFVDYIPESVTPIDGGHICIDGEVLTPESAPYFRRYMAYVPQRLSVPEGYDKVPTDYVELVRRAVDSGKQLLVIDEPAEPLSDERQLAVGHLLIDAVQQGRSVLTVMNPLNDHYIQL